MWMYVTSSRTIFRSFQGKVPATQLTPIVAIIGIFVTLELGVFPTCILTYWIRYKDRITRHRTEIAENILTAPAGGYFLPLM
jgi:hypothetical protein